MSIGPWQVLLVLLIVVLLFGAGKIPRLMGDVAKGIKAFRQGMKEEDEADKGPPKQISHDPPPTAPAADQERDKSQAR